MKKVGKFTQEVIDFHKSPELAFLKAMDIYNDLQCIKQDMLRDLPDGFEGIQYMILAEIEGNQQKAIGVIEDIRREYGIGNGRIDENGMYAIQIDNEIMKRKLHAMEDSDGNISLDTEVLQEILRQEARANKGENTEGILRETEDTKRNIRKVF